MHFISIHLSENATDAQLAKARQIIDIVQADREDATDLAFVPAPPPPVSDANAAAAAFTQPVVAAPPPPPSGATVTVDLDPDGLPWDARIHAGTKTRNADGRWKMKKGVDDTIKAAVIAELRNVYPVPATAAVVTPPPPAATAGATPPPPPPSTGTSDGTFVGFMKRITGLFQPAAPGLPPRLTQADVLAFCTACGVPSVVALAAADKLPLIPTVEALIDQHLAAQA